MGEPTEIFENLECNDTEIVERARTEIYGLFQNTRDSWVVNGLYDYYVNSNSLRSMEILANVNQPHHKYLFDRLNESLKRQETELKVKALTLLGHIVRKQPTWIYKIHDHPLMREILYVLKTEDDILALISALLLVIVLMPMIPSLIADYLQEIFDIFSRLAAWNLGTGALYDKQMMIHMQISLYALFLRLYGMYPCNFIAYLQGFYKDKNNPVFTHTIQPMLETVRMHPRLVTTTRDSEITAERWKTVGAQQIIAECEQFYVDVVDKCPHDCCYVSTGFRSRSGTTNSSIGRTRAIFPDRLQVPLTAVLESNPVPLYLGEEELPTFQLGQLKDLCTLPPQEDKPFFTPSFAFPDRVPLSSAPTDIVQTHFMITSSHEGSSPPEAAIEATPETTPIRDSHSPAIIRSPHVGSSVVRGITSFTKIRSANTTPTHSQPSSPMRKESSPFNFPSTSTGIVHRPFVSNQRLQKMLYERSQNAEAHAEIVSGVKSLNVPSSPVKIIVSSGHSRKTDPLPTADEKEIKEIVAHKKDSYTSSKRGETVLHDDNESSIDNTLEQGSPCSQGGLHMPNSRSMTDFAKRVQRLRYYSQNYDKEPAESSTGSSPGKDSSTIQLLDTVTVRRAHSCPEMKKKSPVSMKEKKPLKESEEEVCEQCTNAKEEPHRSEEETCTKEKTTDSKEVAIRSEEKVQISLITRETQTEDSYMPYEHLFLNIFPCLGSTDTKSSPSSSPMPLKPFGDKESQHSVYNVLDRYMEIAKGDISNPTVQIQLLQQQLLFERYRRETFSARNRKLLADAKNIKALEEYNSALKDTVQLQQRDIDYMTSRLRNITREHFEEERRLLNYRIQLEDRLLDLQSKVDSLQDELNKEKQNLAVLNDKYTNSERERQQACASLFEAYAEMNIAKEQAAMGDKARLEVERLNKEVLLLGELQLKYQEKLAEAERTQLVDVELEMITQSYKEEMKALKSKLDSLRARMEAYRQRVMDLESILSQKDEGIAQLKRNLMDVNAENYEKIKAVESKYQTQLSINRALEQKMLQLYTKIELPGLRSLHSPETSSCHEAIATASVSGLSPHSSPLSVSLASSGSSTAFLSSDIKDVRNLQGFLDKKSDKPEDAVESAGDSMEMLEQPSTSGTQPSASSTQPSPSKTQRKND